MFSDRNYRSCALPRLVAHQINRHFAARRWNRSPRIRIGKIPDHSRGPLGDPARAPAWPSEGNGAGVLAWHGHPFPSVLQMREWQPKLVKFRRAAGTLGSELHLASRRTSPGGMDRRPEPPLVRPSRGGFRSREFPRYAPPERRCTTTCRHALLRARAPSPSRIAPCQREKNECSGSAPAHPIQVGRGCHFPQSSSASRRTAGAFGI